MKRTKNMIYKQTAESKELALFIENTSSLYKKRTLPIIKNLQKKYKKGVFDKNKAVDAFYPLAVEGAKEYCKEFTFYQPYYQIFDVTARFTAACDLVDAYMEHITQ